MNYQL